ncbi:DNA topology modulation protein [Paenibacillus daejeonensis]|uniref:DNA topology modulation protein n=1 Tax=Paenibacillus daejeonensis TaxID=135193 RepID=UPI00037067B3|nr:DNA topology modulation protein [Paenibacillus daejeonensis]
MDRIVVVGSAGAGKSTLVQRLSEILNLPAIHLDKYYWQPGWVATPNEEWDRLVEGMVKEPRWIIDGNYSRTMDLRLARADMVIYLDIPRWRCMYRIFKRRIMYHKKSRPDMNEGCQEKIDLPFIKWVWNYPKRGRLGTLQKLEQMRDRTNVIIVRTPKEVDALIQQIEDKKRR